MLALSAQALEAVLNHIF
ncbi:hypothetical protein HND92_14020 [Diaphorobacter sp. JS3050]|nr:hypothetical protein HND92_14020 [Diaphorobacter sp. JS3050]QYY27435.1 hypothetical protein K2L43_13620 [Diaphorobacter sp. MNS-0]